MGTNSERRSASPSSASNPTTPSDRRRNRSPSSDSSAGSASKSGSDRDSSRSSSPRSAPLAIQSERGRSDDGPTGPSPPPRRKLDRSTYVNASQGEGDLVDRFSAAAGQSSRRRSPSESDEEQRQRKVPRLDSKEVVNGAADAAGGSAGDLALRSEEMEQRRTRGIEAAVVKTEKPQPDTQHSAVLQTAPAKAAPKSFADRMGGAYIPPARLRAMQAAITDKSSVDYQRMTWEGLKKSLNGLINKVNTSNIKMIVPELFSENLIRGRGLLCRSIMKAQAASLPFTPVYAALISVVNTKFPQIGDLLLSRLIVQFRRAYRRNDKTVCLAVTKFLGHLVNQKVAHEIVALQILTLLLERPTDDSVEVAVGFMRDVGAFLGDYSSRANNAIFERFRSILHDGAIDKRTQYMVEVLFQVRKEKYKDHPAVPEELELVEDEDQITHHKSLDDDDLETEEVLNVFKEDPDFVENEAKYNAIKKEILGDSDDDDGDDEEEDGDGDDEDGDEEDEAAGQEMLAKARQEMEIRDATNTNLINLRRAIYLTIMSSLNFEECAHKLMKLGVREGQEIELSNMIKDCCSQERTYVNFFGLLGERFCRLGQNWANAFSQTFEESYNTIHRCETNRLRNTAKYFAHLLATDALPWTVMALIRLTEEDTTSASRIFVKILFEELNGSLGLARLKERLFDKNMVITVQAGNGGMETRSAFAGLFPLDNPRNTRFAINYFTSIKLGALTTEMREHLKNAPKLIMAQQQEVESSDESSSESSSDSDSNSDSSSDSDSDSDSGDSSSSGSDSDSSAGAKDSNSRKKKEEGKREAQSDGRTAIGDRGRNGSSRGEENGRSRRNGHDAIDRSTSERERNRDAERKGESGMNRSRGRDDVDRSRERGGGRQRDDSRLRERERERDRERDRESDRERDRDRDRDRDRERDRERNGRESERNGRRGDEDRERDRDRQRQSDRDKRR